MYVCVPQCIPGIQGGKKGTLDPLELELQAFVSCHAGIVN